MFLKTGSFNTTIACLCLRDTQANQGTYRLLIISGKMFVQVRVPINKGHTEVRII